MAGGPLGDTVKHSKASDQGFTLWLTRAALFGEGPAARDVTQTPYQDLHRRRGPRGEHRRMETSIGGSRSVPLDARQLLFQSCSGGKR